jgi:hypothetical protein
VLLWNKIVQQEGLDITMAAVPHVVSDKLASDDNQAISATHNSVVKLLALYNGS